MAISCAKCGRQYDAALFQFGRTINCACGERVGFEHRLNLPPNSEIKFFADVNVARLVRWLRAMGFDTAWEDAISDGDLIRRAIEEKRFVLTLDKKIAREFRADNILLLESENPFKQLRQVVERFEIKNPKELFRRCLICNAPLQKISAARITNEVPPRVLENYSEFHFCPTCEKVFWEGSHTKRMRDAIEKIIT